MGKFKDFGTGADVGNKEPISFMLYEQTFNCQIQLQGKVLLELTALSNGKDASEAAAMIPRFFEYVLLPEDYVRFDALCSDPATVVTVESLGEITGWLVEQYADRPSEGPTVS